MRSSIGDRHIKNHFRTYQEQDINFPKLEFDDNLSRKVHHFQEYLSYSLSAINDDALGYWRIGDIFYGWLFVFTLFKISRRRKLSFNNDTNLIINCCKKLLNRVDLIQKKFNSEGKSIGKYFIDLTNRLNSNNQMRFIVEDRTVRIHNCNNTILRISNRFIDIYQNETISSILSGLRFSSYCDNNSARPLCQGKFSIK